MAFSASAVVICSYRYNSIFQPLRVIGLVLELVRSHLHCHRVTKPPLQGQKQHHQDDYKYTHGHWD